MRIMCSTTRLSLFSYLLLLSVLVVVTDANAQSASTASAPRVGPTHTITTAGAPAIILPADRVDPAITDSGNVTLTINQELYTRQVNLSDIRLGTQDVTVKKAEALPQLVESMGIKWDVNSIRVIYDLNPDLADIRSVPAGANLLLPKIGGNSALVSVMSTRYPASLTTDQTTRQEALAREAELRRLYDSLQKIPSSRFNRPEDKEAIVKSIDVAWRALSDINSDQSPAGQKVLRQSILEAGKLKLFLDQSVRPDGSVDKSLINEAIIKAAIISEALGERGNDIKNGGSGRAGVEVHTIKQADGSAVPLLRVFYRPELAMKIEKYRTPSTPTTEALPVGGTFILWAGKGDDPKALSDHQTITVKSKGNDPVKLLVQE